MNTNKQTTTEKLKIATGVAAKIIQQSYHRIKKSDNTFDAVKSELGNFTRGVSNSVKNGTKKAVKKSAKKTGNALWNKIKQTPEKFADKITNINFGAVENDELIAGTVGRFVGKSIDGTFAVAGNVVDRGTDLIDYLERKQQFKSIVPGYKTIRNIIKESFFGDSVVSGTYETKGFTCTIYKDKKTSVLKINNSSIKPEQTESNTLIKAKGMFDFIHKTVKDVAEQVTSGKKLSEVYKEKKESLASQKSLSEAINANNVFLKQLDFSAQKFMDLTDMIKGNTEDPSKAYTIEDLRVELIGLREGINQIYDTISDCLVSEKISVHKNDVTDFLKEKVDKYDSVIRNLEQVQEIKKDETQEKPEVVETAKVKSDYAMSATALKKEVQTVAIDFNHLYQSVVTDIQTDCPEEIVPEHETVEQMYKVIHQEVQVAKKGKIKNPERFGATIDLLFENIREKVIELKEEGVIEQENVPVQIEMGKKKLAYKLSTILNENTLKVEFSPNKKGRDPYVLLTQDYVIQK
ncbi:MAG: hypothetical protein ABIC91_05690 [Nanoarchaeota archaeon]|nr:hypothetical protein [Nanoarchaeota archaeon]MBU1030850.1 hypothetical protein [Nanoarchaeota archaeon]MBU1849144.1 hypothetical protein [Nanoarchaeota archaeon]